MKGNATVLLDLWAKEKKKSCRAVFFFFFCPVFELYQSENHCYSKSFALFCLEAQDLQCQLSPILLDSKPARQPANGWMSQSGAEGGWGWGGVSTECLFAVVLWVSGSSPTVQNFLLGSTWPFLHLKQFPPPTAGQSWLSAAHSISHGGGQPLLISQYFDTEITLAGRCISHVSGFFFFLYSDHLTFSDFFFHVDLHAVVCKLLAAEQALHCSYAETLWSEVPLYVHPVYWMQNEDQYYRPLMIVNCVELLMLLCLTVFCSTSRLVPWVVFKKKKEEKKKGFSDRDVCVCRSKLLRLFSICPSPSSGPLPSC